MMSEVLQESDYLQIEPYSAYMRMQVGNERTRPFLIRMKAPGSAKYADSIPAIKKRTATEAGAIENNALQAVIKQKNKKELEEMETYDAYLVSYDENSIEYKGLNTNEAAASLDQSILKDENEPSESKKSIDTLETEEFKQTFDLVTFHLECNKVDQQPNNLLVERKEKQTHHESIQSVSVGSSHETKEEQKKRQTDDKKRTVSNEDLWL